MRNRLAMLAEAAAAVLLFLVGVPLILFGALLAMRAGTPQEVQWYEATAMIPFVPGVLACAAATWLSRDARGRRRGLTPDERLREKWPSAY
jgi:hypothetical protein